MECEIVNYHLMKHCVFLFTFLCNHNEKKRQKERLKGKNTAINTSLLHTPQGDGIMRYLYKEIIKIDSFSLLTTSLNFGDIVAE